ncbi:MAG: glycosyltransferase [Bacteroidota bacterium]
MQKMFKRGMLLCPPKYSLYNVFTGILGEICSEVSGVNVMSYVKPYEVKINTQIFRLPYSIRNKWIEYFQQKINNEFLMEFRRLSPDLVFIYNSEMLLPSTVLQIKKTAKVIFFLGDSPFFTNTNNYFLTILNLGDLVLAADSFWLQQIQTVGIKNTSFFVPGIDGRNYHQNPDINLMNKIKETDIIYCGMGYVNSWGFKKAMLMSKFVGLNFEIYGDKHWKKWFTYFPELINVFHESGFIPTPELNAMFNKTKLMPVDGNPGILNGFHIRVFEALSAGVLPIIEYRKDLEESVFFGLDIQLPIIKSYDDALNIAEYYLANENLRLNTVKVMRDHVLAQFNSEKNGERILRNLSRLS